MGVREDLVAAKALIDTPRKWRKGDYDRGGRCCAVGAVVRVVGGEISDAEYSSAALALEAALLPEQGKKVFLFNDNPTTTHADIMALFDRAIAAAEAAS